MSGHFAAVLVAFAAWTAAAAPLPSGLEAEVYDAGIEVQPDGARWYVMRYLAPEIGGIGYEAVVADLQHLCETEGLAALQPGNPGEDAEEIVVILMDRPVPRGTPDADATQFIGAYLPTDEGCEWY